MKINIKEVLIIISLSIFLGFIRYFLLDEEFFLITESTQEQILLKNQLKLSRQQLFLSSISFLVGGWMALASQPGSVYGPLVVIISSGVLVDSKINYLYPVISFESAKIIAEQYNKNLLLKNNHQAPD